MIEFFWCTYPRLVLQKNAYIYQTSATQTFCYRVPAAHCLLLNVPVMCFKRKK